MSSTKWPGSAPKRILALGAAGAVAFATALAAVPASAVNVNDAPPAVPSPAVSSPPGGSESSTAAVPPSGGPEGSTAAGTEVSGSGLAEAAMRDLGLTPDEFSAAGELGKQAAAAASALRDVPGYIGTRLQDGRILVTGSGAELKAAVAELGKTVPAVALEAPASEPAKAPVPSSPATGRELAGSTHQLFQDYLRDVGPEGLQAVAYSGGRFVIRAGGVNASESALQKPDSSTDAANTGPATNNDGKISAREFVARYANVELDDGAELAPEADVVGGQGYFADTREICSTGFSAFDPVGLPSFLTAGHCSADGTAENATLEYQALPAGLLGTFGFSQFGGPGNTGILDPVDQQNPGNVGTDVAVIEKIRSDLDPAPASSTWGDPSEPGPDVKVIGSTTPVEGQPVCRSGRTSAWSCGTVDEVGIYVVQGRSAEATDLRAFNGFLSYGVQSSGGDSGGPWISGNYAVGIHSAGDVPDQDGNVKNFAIAATLNDALAVLPGYQLELFLNKPELVAPADARTVAAGDTITGHVPAAPASGVAANSKVHVTVGTEVLEVPVDAAGNWSFRAPLPSGPLSFSAETVNGFSRSGVVPFALTVGPSPLPAPVITTPSVVALAELKSVEGTGMPGAVVALSGDVAGSGTVGLDGHWVVPLDSQAAFGKVTVSVILSSPGIPDSLPAAETFTVMPPAPSQSTISDGMHVSQDSLPETISGTGVDGAEVTVTVDGVPVGEALVSAAAGVGTRAVARAVDPVIQVSGGLWSVPFPAGLAIGTHTLEASQAVDRVASPQAVAAFTIDVPAPALPATPVPPLEAAAPPQGAPVLPSGDLNAVGGNGSTNTPRLANTGATGIMMAASLAAGAIAVGGLLMLLARRRKRRASRKES